MSEWLRAHKLEAYVEVFENNGITGLDLLDLTHPDLLSMGVAKCTDRKAILRYDAVLVNSVNRNSWN